MRVKIDPCSNRVSNLTLACTPCNQTKGNQTTDEFGYPLIQAEAKRPLKNAACVGCTGQQIYVPAAMTALEIKAAGHERRQMCLMDRYRFSRTSQKQSSVVRGFRTGDIAYAYVPSGKKASVNRGRIAVRKTGYFRVETVDGIRHKYCSILQAADGYEYSTKSKGEGIPPRS